MGSIRVINHVILEFHHIQPTSGERVTPGGDCRTFHLDRNRGLLAPAGLRVPDLLVCCRINASESSNFARDPSDKISLSATIGLSLFGLVSYARLPDIAQRAHTSLT